MQHSRTKIATVSVTLAFVAHVYSTIPFKPYKWRSPSGTVIQNVRSQAFVLSALQWRHNERDGVSTHQPHDFFITVYAQIEENIKTPRHWPFWRNSPVTGEFPAERSSYADVFPFDDVIMERSYMLQWDAVVFQEQDLLTRSYFVLQPRSKLLFLQENVR